jgi:hypothetical protein
MSFFMNSDFLDSNVQRKRLKRLRKVVQYAIFPLLIALTALGVLKENKKWCYLAETCLIVSSIITLALFVCGIGMFLYRRGRDPAVTVKVRRKLCRPRQRLCI